MTGQSSSPILEVLKQALLMITGRLQSDLGVIQPSATMQTSFMACSTFFARLILAASGQGIPQQAPLLSGLSSAASCNFRAKKGSFHSYLTLCAITVNLIYCQFFFFFFNSVPSDAVALRSTFSTTVMRKPKSCSREDIFTELFKGRDAAKKCKKRALWEQEWKGIKLRQK